MGEHVVVLSGADAEPLSPAQSASITEHARLEVVLRPDAPDASEAAHLLRHATVLATTPAAAPALDDALLGRLPRLRSLVVHSGDAERLALGASARRRLAVTTLPDHSSGAVAEHALGLLLSLATRSHLANDRSRGRVDASTSLQGIELCGSTLGVLGVGRVGLHLARIATGIGMRVVGADPDATARRTAEHVGIEMTSTDEVLHRARALAVCASAAPQTPPLLDLAALGALQPGALLVNVGRPDLVDTDAVVAALRLRHLRGYAVDGTPFDRLEHADLMAEGRIVQTGHSAGWRDEVLARGAEHLARAILAAVRRETSAGTETTGEEQVA